MLFCDNQSSKGLFEGTLVEIFCVFWPKAPALMGVRGALGVHCPGAKGPQTPSSFKMSKGCCWQVFAGKRSITLKS